MTLFNPIAPGPPWLEEAQHLMRRLDDVHLIQKLLLEESEILREQVRLLLEREPDPAAAQAGRAGAGEAPRDREAGKA